MHVTLHQKKLVLRPPRFRRGYREPRQVACVGVSDSENLQNVATAVDELQNKVRTAEQNTLDTATNLTGRVDAKVTEFNASLEAQLGRFKDSQEKSMKDMFDAQKKSIDAQFTSFRETVITVAQFVTILVAGWAGWTGAGRTWPFPPAWLLVGALVLGAGLILITTYARVRRSPGEV